MNRVLKTYAQALYKAAIEQNLNQQTMNEFEENLNRLSHSVQTSSDLKAVLKSPQVTSDEKISILKKLTLDNSSSNFINLFLNLLKQKGRFEILDQIGESFTEVKLTSQGVVMGLVESAEPLKEIELKELADSFEKKSGKKIFFKSKLDSNLLAGVKVTVSGITYDGTVRAQINQLREKLSLSKT